MRTSELPEADLIRRAATGDERAMEALYRTHARRLYAVLRRIAVDDATAEDWAQETWIRAFASLGRFRGESKLTTWLYRIAVNTASELRRRVAARAPTAPPSRELRVESHEDRVLARAAVERALARLPAAMRAVVVLYELEGFSHDEIAALLSIRAATSRSHLFKARVRLQGLLGAADDAPPTEGS